MTHQKRGQKLPTDEMGRPTRFVLPYHALYYDTARVTIQQEMKIESKQLDIAGRALTWEDHNEQMLFDDNDRMDIVKRIKRLGKWI